MGLIIIGLAGIVLSAILSRRRINQSGLPPELWEDSAGTGIVSSWISLMNIISWILLGIGVLSLVL